jgi:hypothetical protein
MIVRGWEGDAHCPVTLATRITLSARGSDTDLYTVSFSAHFDNAKAKLSRISMQNSYGGPLPPFVF